MPDNFPQAHIGWTPVKLITGAEGSETDLSQLSPISISSVEFTRPADTTAYASSDAVSNSTSAPTILTFSSVLPLAGGDGVIMAVRAMTNQSTFSTTLRLHLYKNTVSAINDNAAFTTLYSQRADRVGFIDLSGWGVGGSGSDAAACVVTNINLPIELASGSTTLYGLLEARGAFTPANAQQFFISLKTVLT